MSYIYLSHTASPLLIEWLSGEGHNVVLMPDNPMVYSAICSHADLAICRLGLSASSPIFAGNPKGENYPNCATLCAAANDKYFIHNTKITDPALLGFAEEIGLETIHVNQGFTRCNLLCVGNGFITGDSGIVRVLKKNGLPTLQIAPGHIELPGHNEGFIGGCAGIVGNIVVFHGNLSAHPDNNNIRGFIAKFGYTIKDFPQFRLTDIGSIIESDKFINPLNLSASALL